MRLSLGFLLSLLLGMVLLISGVRYKDCLVCLSLFRTPEAGLHRGLSSQCSWLIQQEPVSREHAASDHASLQRVGAVCHGCSISHLLPPPAPAAGNRRRTFP